MSELREVRTPVGALAVAVTAMLLFAPSLTNGFAYDDVPIILGDARVQSFEHLGAIFTRGWWADADLALYRPLTTLTFALDWQLAPGSAAGSIWSTCCCTRAPARSCSCCSRDSGRRAQRSWAH